MVAYETDLDLFEAIHRRTGDLRTTIRTIVTAARDADDPFAAVRTCLLADIAKPAAPTRLPGT
jgi:hypothetical protein